MAEADADQKTFHPTDKRLSEARAKGEVASAPEMKHAAMFAAALIVIGGMGSYTLTRFSNMFTGLWGGADKWRIDPRGAESFAITVAAETASAIAPIMATLFAFAIIGGLLQGRPTFAWARVAPKWSKLNPFSGLMRMLAPRALIEFGKTVAKMVAVIVIAVYVLRPKLAGIDRLIGADPAAIGAASGAIIFDMVRAVALLVAALALFDFIYQHRAFIKRMRMSLQELRDEHKEQDGDPKIKAKIRQMQMQRARSRMMAAVPKASVVITNPTHFAVALRYDHGAMAAPVVVAKGVDGVAMKIREVAAANRIPIVENRPLARALFAQGELDRPIPAEHYAAVAEIISYVLKMARLR